MNSVIKFIMKFKKRIVLVLFTIPFVITICIQHSENYKNERWDYKVLADFDFKMDNKEKFKSELKKLNKDDISGIAKFKENYKEEIRKFLPTSAQYKDWNCFKKFNTNTDDWKEIIINSLGVLGTGSINDECFENTSKWWLFVSYIFVYIAVFFTLIIIFIDKVRRWFSYKNHTVIIGLNSNTRKLIKDLSINNNIKIYENDINNIFIKELDEEGEYLITGKLEYIFEKDILKAKEIFIMNDTDSESMNSLALIIDKFNEQNNKQNKNKTKIYIEIKNRDNRVFFDKKGLYNLVDEEKNFEIVQFSLNELISQRMFTKRPLVSNLKKNEKEYLENLKILIVGFNDLSEEILYNILKLAHFDLNKYVEITMLDDSFSYINEKYKKLIEKGKNPLHSSTETYWNLKFLPFSKLYDDKTFLCGKTFNFNRIILCDKKYSNTMEILNYINNNYYTELSSKKTIIQVYNEHININNRIDFDKQTYKNFFTFGDIDTIVSYENITNNRLYEISKTTNDYKEEDTGKKWTKLDSFTRESNITEKLHMNVKLDIFSLIICEKKSEILNDKEKIDDIFKNYYNKNKDNLKNHLNEAIKLPYALDNLTKLVDFYIIKSSANGMELYKKLDHLEKDIELSNEEKNKLKELEDKLIKLNSTSLCERNKSYIENIKTIQQKINEIKSSKKEANNKLKEHKEIVKETLNSTIKEILNEKNKINFYDNVQSKLKYSNKNKNEENMVILMAISLVTFYLKVKDTPNYLYLIDNLAELEHKRWNVYHILNGWKYGLKKDPIKKEHNNLCDWKTLNEKYKSAIKYDYKNIYQIPFVVHCLGGEINLISEFIREKNVTK